MAIPEAQIKLLTEVMNIGAARSATRLSLLLRDEIEVDVPEVTLVNDREAAAILSAAEKRQKSIVCQEMTGVVTGSAHFIFYPGAGTALVETMIGNVSVADAVDMRVFERDALLEVSNIIISTSMTILAETLNGEVYLTDPTYVPADEPERIQEVAGTGFSKMANVLVVHTELLRNHHTGFGSLVIMLSEDSAQRITREMDPMAAQSQR